MGLGVMGATEGEPGRAMPVAGLGVCVGGAVGSSTDYFRCRAVVGDARAQGKGSEYIQTGDEATGQGRQRLW